MRKKFMLVAALAGILSLGACVDDKESSSVESVRNAKAEQLKALANLYNAQAEAELITANAEKAYKDAQTEWQKNQTEEAKQTFAIRLEQIKAEAEAAMLEAKLRAAQYEMDLLAQADEKLNSLYRTYKNGLDKLHNLNQDLLGYKMDIAGLEAGIVTAEAYVKQQTIIQNNVIARKTAFIDALKKLPENNKAALEAEIEGYNVKLIPLNADLEVKNDAVIKAGDAYGKESDNFYPYSNSSIKLIQAVRGLYDMGYSYVVARVYYDLTDNRNITQYSLFQDQVTSTRNDINREVAYFKEVLGAPTKGTTPATGVYVGFEALQDAYKVAKDAYNADKSEQNRYAMEAAKADVERYENNELKNAKTNLANCEAKLAEFNTLVAAFAGENLTAYNTELANLKKLAEAYEKAEDARDEVNDKIRDIDDLKDSVNRILAGLIDLPQAIADAELAIADAQEAIANLVNVATAERALADIKEKIAKTESLIAAQKIIVAKAKAALDAALA